MQIIDCKQLSIEWGWLKLGLITGTRMSQARSKRKNSLYGTLVYERMHDEKVDEFSGNEFTAIGNEREPIARQMYEEKHGVKVDTVGFILHNDYVGFSPDGVMLTAGLIVGGIEIKCPQKKAHQEHIDGVLSGQKMWQCIGGIWVTGSDYWDFISYCPEHETPWYERRIERDDGQIDELRAGCESLIERVKIKMEGFEMPNVNDLGSSNYVSKEDAGDGILVTIKSYKKVDVSRDDEPADVKWTLEFDECKPLVLNKTNGNKIASILGDGDFDAWIGKQVVLWNNPDIEYKGKVTGGVRVRAPRDPDADPLPF